MQNRTIQDLHNKYYGHRKFAKICDLLIEDGYEVTEIKEFYEKFLFKVNGEFCEFQKDWKSSAKDYVKYFEQMTDFKKELMKKKGLYC